MRDRLSRSAGQRSVPRLVWLLAAPGRGRTVQARSMARIIKQNRKERLFRIYEKDIYEIA
jgi:hypothetical protein